MKKHPLREFKETPGATLGGFKSLLAEDVIFSSPIFTRDLVGKDLVSEVMLTSTTVRDGKFTHEFKRGNSCCYV
jgi:hypothetical protein